MSDSEPTIAEVMVALKELRSEIQDLRSEVQMYHLEARVNLAEFRLYVTKLLGDLRTHLETLSDTLADDRSD